ncbi:MAG: hypothetical protein ACYDGN_16270 [Acidimicrobiales bacterium]
MARITKSTRELHAGLVAEGIDGLTLGQLQFCHEARLDPLPGNHDRAAHWRAIGAIAEGRERLPDYDDVAMTLALEGFPGFPTARLRGAIRRLGEVPTIEDVEGAKLPGQPGFDTDEYCGKVTWVEEDADRLDAQLVAEPGLAAVAASLGREDDYGAHMAHLANMAAMLQGGRSDLAGEIGAGSDPETRRAGVEEAAALFQSIGGAMPAMAKALDAADETSLARAVRAADSLLPASLATATIRYRAAAGGAAILLAVGQAFQAQARRALDAASAEDAPAATDPTTQEVLAILRSMSEDPLGYVTTIPALAKQFMLPAPIGSVFPPDLPE